MGLDNPTDRTFVVEDTEKDKKVVAFSRWMVPQDDGTPTKRKKIVQTIFGAARVSAITMRLRGLQRPLRLCVRPKSEGDSHLTALTLATDSR